MAPVFHPVLHIPAPLTLCIRGKIFRFASYNQSLKTWAFTRLLVHQTASVQDSSTKYQRPVVPSYSAAQSAFRLLHNHILKLILE
jgi:hypothetical protein